MRRPIIVIVDDDPFDVLPLKSELEALECDVSLCPTVVDALDRLVKSQRPCDLALVDVVMPTESVFSSGDTAEGTLTGVKLIQTIHAVRSHLAVVVLSVRHDAEVKAKLAAIPTVRFAPKPFLVEQLALELASLARDEAERS